VHRLKALHELQREHPADNEDDSHHLDVEASRGAAAVQRVPDDCQRAERERGQFAEVAKRSQEQRDGETGSATRRRAFAFAVPASIVATVSIIIWIS